MRHPKAEPSDWHYVSNLAGTPLLFDIASVAELVAQNGRTFWQGHLARRMSSLTIEQLKGRSRDRLLRTIFVNLGGKPGVRLAQNHHQSTRKNGLKSRVMLSICQFICSFCLF